MTAETRQEVAHQQGAAERFGRCWDKYLQKRLDMYPYDSVEILVYLAGDYVDIGLYTRSEPSFVADDAADTQFAPQRCHAATRLRQGYLHEDVDFYVINANEWGGIDPVMIELDARMAESFGQYELAAVARTWIH